LLSIVILLWLKICENHKEAARHERRVFGGSSSRSEGGRGRQTANLRQRVKEEAWMPFFGGTSKCAADVVDELPRLLSGLDAPE
jgi:hypothetical protein